MSEARRIEVVAGVILRDGKVLVARRGASMSLPGLWEFPGGKVEKDERQEIALAREIEEELGIAIRVDGLINTNSHRYDFAVIWLSTYYASITSGEPAASEHAELRWCSVSDLEGLEWAPADAPAFRQVIADLSEG